MKRWEKMTWNIMITLVVMAIVFKIVCNANFDLPTTIVLCTIFGFVCGAFCALATLADL